MTIKIRSLVEHKKKKQSKLIIKELTFLLKIINIALRAFNRYQKYTSIKEIKRVMEEHKQILEIHLNNQKRILENEES